LVRSKGGSGKMKKQDVVRRLKAAAEQDTQKSYEAGKEDGRKLPERMPSPTKLARLERDIRLMIRDAAYYRGFVEGAVELLGEPGPGFQPGGGSPAPTQGMAATLVTAEEKGLAQHGREAGCKEMAGGCERRAPGSSDG
jgi:hypothetical protein